MNIIEFKERFPNEHSCRKKLKELREKIGITCKRCGYKKHYWLEKIQKWQCSSCNSRTNLKAGTILTKSQIPIHYWFMMIYFILNFKKPISTEELRYQFGLKTYRSIWNMRQKVLILIGELHIQKKDF